jgi:hypothetical protein
MLREPTKAILEAIPKVREKWIKIGLATAQPGDREKAWEGAKKMYRLGGRDEPKLWI